MRCSLAWAPERDDLGFRAFSLQSSPQTDFPLPLYMQPVEQQAGESQRSVATTGTVLTTRGPVIPATGTQTKLGKGTYILDAVVRLYAT
jgi:hypothetical protein